MPPDCAAAHLMGDPIHTVIEAPAALAAEEATARLRFGEPWAHPMTLEAAKGTVDFS